jgi:hypothetical protein
MICQPGGAGSFILCGIGQNTATIKGAPTGIDDRDPAHWMELNDAKKEYGWTTSPTARSKSWPSSPQTKPEFDSLLDLLQLRLR